MSPAPHEPPQKYGPKSSKKDGSPLLILGASVRAAAMSAIRGGFRPRCADLFADRDLKEIAPVTKVTDYPQGLIAASRKVESCDWIYTGAMENHLEAVTEISIQHQLLGNAPEIVAAVRDPFRVADCLRKNGIPVLSVRSSNNPPTADGTWLRKPLNGSAGHGIGIWDSATARTVNSYTGYFFQRRGTGESMAAIYLATKNRTSLLGVTLQLVGERTFQAALFSYCGSIGPIDCGSEFRAQVQCLGESLGAEFSLRGLFGVDFLRVDGSIFLTEINPRYTASVELLELSMGQSLLHAHRKACLSFDENPAGEFSVELPERKRNQKLLGKAILFAKRDLIVPDGDINHSPVQQGDFTVPRLADIPDTGLQIRVGEPICTIFGEGDSTETCLISLKTRASELYSKFHRKKRHHS